MKKTLKGNMLPMNIQMFATSQTFPEPNLQDRASLIDLEAKSIDFTYRFAKDMRDFMNILGLFDGTPVQEGYTIKTKKTDTVVDLKDGAVPEGEIIPLSKVKFGEGSSLTIDSKFWRKNTTYQAIQKYGADQAIDQADREILGKIQSEIRSDMFGFLKTTAATKVNLRAGSLQGAVATSWGYLESLFEGANQTIAFANPMDIADYLAHTPVTTQTAFGVTYLQVFTNTTLIASNQVAQGEILATVPNNIKMFYIPASSEGGRAFNMISDDTGFIGLARQTKTENASIDTLFTSGIKLAPEIEDGVVKVTIGKVVPAG